jgi:dihydroorotase
MGELVLKGGRVIDPSQNLDGIADIIFAEGRVKAIGRNLVHGRDAEVKDVKGLIVTPGLIDLHTHVYWGGTSLGVDAADIARRSGTTTFVDAGSAGAGNFHGFRRHVIEPSPVRILGYLNIAYPGIFAFSAAVMVGECADIRLLDLRECRRVAEANRDLVVGIKVRVGRGAGGGSGVAPLDMALEVADAVGLPVMAHLDFPPPSRLEVVTRLRKGDVLTHCFRPFPNAPAAPDGGVREEIAAARERGVIFDIGHGGGSFGFATATAMLEAGFKPDVISSDVHVLSIDGPAFDLLHTMSKFLCLGQDLSSVIRAATAAPAAAIGRSDLGTLKPGAIGDATLLDIAEGSFT